MNLYFPQISQSFNTESTEFFHREHKDCILCLSFRRNLKETMILIKLKISRWLRRLHRFLTQRAQRIHREHIDCILCLSFRRNIKESYDFDKINSFSRIPQIAQIFNTESTEFFHREHKDWILCLSFRRNLKEFMIL